jgi:MFS family permease
VQQLSEGDRQILFLFLSSFVILFIGMGLFPLLPLYAGELGASHGTTGLFLAIIFLANALGPVVAGRLGGLMGRRRLFIAAGVVLALSMALMSRATALWEFMLLTAIVWFAGGVDIALISVMTGNYSGKESRGRSFSLVALAAPLGSLAGGAAIGAMVSHWGYRPMFLAASAWASLVPLMGMFKLKEPQAVPIPSGKTEAIRRSGRSWEGYFLLVGLSLLVLTAANASRLGIPLVMKSLGFSTGAVASTATVSGLIAIPGIIVVGALSDRFGSRRFLLLGYLLASGGALVLIVANELWHFWLAAALMLLAFSISGAMASAVATAILTPKALNTGLSRLQAVQSAAAVLGFAVVGTLFDPLGRQVLYLAAATLPVLAIGLARRLPEIEIPLRKNSRRAGQNSPKNRPNQDHAAPEPCGLEPCPQGA